jgi:hypothetical protein
VQLQCFHRFCEGFRKQTAAHELNVRRRSSEPLAITDRVARRSSAWRACSPPSWHVISRVHLATWRNGASGAHVSPYRLHPRASVRRLFKLVAENGELRSIPQRPGALYVHRDSIQPLYAVSHQRMCCRSQTAGGRIADVARKRAGSAALPAARYGALRGLRLAAAVVRGHGEVAARRTCACLLRLNAAGPAADWRYGTAPCPARSPTTRALTAVGRQALDDYAAVPAVVTFIRAVLEGFLQIMTDLGVTSQVRTRAFGHEGLARAQRLSPPAQVNPLEFDRMLKRKFDSSRDFTIFEQS